MMQGETEAQMKTRRPHLLETGKIEMRASAGVDNGTTASVARTLVEATFAVYYR